MMGHLWFCLSESMKKKQGIAVLLEIPVFEVCQTETSRLCVAVSGAKTVNQTLD